MPAYAGVLTTMNSAAARPIHIAFNTIPHPVLRTSPEPDLLMVAAIG